MGGLHWQVAKDICETHGCAFTFYLEAEEAEEYR